MMKKIAMMINDAAFAYCIVHFYSDRSIAWNIVCIVNYIETVGYTSIVLLPTSTFLLRLSS